MLRRRLPPLLVDDVEPVLVPFPTPPSLPPSKNKSSASKGVKTTPAGKPACCSILFNSGPPNLFRLVKLVFPSESSKENCTCGNATPSTVVAAAAAFLAAAPPLG